MKVYNVSFRFKVLNPKILNPKLLNPKVLNSESETYTIFGIIKDKNDKVIINLGAPGDEFPCIMLEYNRKTETFFVSKLRAQKFGGWKADDRTICTFPPLPTTGVLDILVGLSLAICKKYIGEVSTYLNDGAMTNDKYPLTWLKFFGTSVVPSKPGSRASVVPSKPGSRASVGTTKRILHQTTYSKYGFISRTPKTDKNTQKHFESSIKNLDLYFKKNPNRKKQLIDMFEKRNNPKVVSLYDPEFKDPELKRIDLRGKWYMDWNSYNPFVEILECSIS